MLTIQTKEEFDTIIDKIRVNVELYEKCLTEVQYKIFLANKKVIDINYDKECIPHILGIDMDFLRNLNIYREKNAYDLMKAFLSDSYRVYSKLDDLNKPFSSYVLEKNEIFRDNLKIVLADIECIVEYRKDRVYGLDTLECPCDYYVLQKRSDKPNNTILLLGMVKKGNVFVPRTSQILDLTLPKDQENLKHILFHQNITFVNSLRYSNHYESDSKSFYLDPQSKSNKLLTLNRYASQYESTIAIDGDYAFVLKKLNEVNMNTIKMKSTLQTISSIIHSGDVIDMDVLDEDVDCDIKDVVKAYNNSRFKETDSFKYSELLEEYNKLKQLVTTLQEENQVLQQTSDTREQTIEKLEKENEEYKNTQQKIYSLLQTANGGGLFK